MCASPVPKECACLKLAACDVCYDLFDLISIFLSVAEHLIQRKISQLKEIGLSHLVNIICVSAGSRSISIIFNHKIQATETAFD